MLVQRILRSFFLAFLLSVVVVAAWSATAWAQEEDTTRLEAGARLYAENCAVCHGSDGQGRVGATLQKDWPSIRPDLTVKSIIQNGVAGSVMPAWSDVQGGPLNAEQIEALVYYILSWQTGGPPIVASLPTATLLPPITPIPEVAGDPNRGGKLFTENCVICHGAQGEGRVGANLAKDWAGVRPDLLIQESIARGIAGSKMPAWSQANGGPLTDTDVQDLTAYILTLPKTAATIVEPAQEPFKPSWLAGWGGAVLLVVILVLIIAGALYYQRRFPPKAS